MIKSYFALCVVGGNIQVNGSPRPYFNYGTYKLSGPSLRHKCQAHVERLPASKVAPVYSPLLSGSLLLSAEKSKTFNFTAQLLLNNITFLTKFDIFLIYVHIAVPLKEKDDSLQTFIEHVQYTNNIMNIIFHLSTTHQTSFSIDFVTITCINFMKHLSKKDLRQKKQKMNLAIIVVEDGSNNCIGHHSQENSDW